jgi:aspartyl-tRNA(Asn)/glutamyl-tRNA(Gln) amidotransferase subunit C
MDLNVDYVAKLARVKLTEKEEKKFSEDLVKILDHFKDLQAVNTEGVAPLTGGHNLKSVMRADKAEKFEDRKGLLESFPDKEGDYLKVPPVFE